MLFVHSNVSLYEHNFVPTLGGFTHMPTPSPSLLNAPSKLMFHISFSMRYFGSVHSAAFHAVSSSDAMMVVSSSSSKLR
jgi:hypothetical protein